MIHKAVLVLGYVLVAVAIAACGSTPDPTPAPTPDTEARAQAMAKKILGSILGVASIPNRWLNRLELRDTIDVISRDLHSISKGSRFELSHTALRHRYPPA
jgi:hypothetical protein